jgi:hypothetical protein
MMKLISLMVQLTVLAGVLLALQGGAVRRLAEARNSAAATASDEAGNRLPGFDLASMFLNLPPQPAGPTGPTKPAAPPRPSTLIHYVGPDGQRGHAGETAVMELPPGAHVMVVDGRLQIFRPAGPPKARKAARREIVEERKRDQDETPGVIDIGGTKVNIAEILGQGQGR